MLQLPKQQRDPRVVDQLCKCRPICKSRRRAWKGEIHNPSAELLFDRKPTPECIQRWPKKVNFTKPCPLLGLTREVHLKEHKDPTVVRICQAPIDDVADTTYLRYAQMARRLGAIKAVPVKCPFCGCCTCCACDSRGYKPKDAERRARRRDDMRVFDRRVKLDCQEMRIMYQ